MHYYQFHIGDYLSHTAHLKPLEDLAYRRLLDLYYSTELPISTDVKSVARLIRLPVAPVQIILDEFFELTDAGYKNNRADQEILMFQGFIEAGKRGAAKRWAKAPHSPPIEPPIPTNNHKPKPINQEPIKNKDIRTDINFEEIKKAYPKRGGGQRWQDAERFYNTRLQEGVSHQEILDGVYRYARYCDQTGKTNTEYVQQAATFFGRNQGYREPWTPPAMVKDVRQMSAPERVRMAMSQKDDRVINVQPENKLLDVFDLTKLVR